MEILWFFAGVVGMNLTGYYLITSTIEDDIPMMVKGIGWFLFGSYFTLVYLGSVVERAAC